MHSSRTFGIVGYSTRALVQAVTELGHRAVAIDAFGDQDTIDMAQTVHVIRDWPSGILDAARSTPVDAWLLAGGMENCEGLLSSPCKNTSKNQMACKSHVEALSDLAPVLGPDLIQMQTLRSPNFWASLCHDGIHWPTTSFVRPADDLTLWLVKPVRSAGGWLVRSAETEPIDVTSDGTCYWQRRIDGRVLGVTWILRPGNCRLLGITASPRQGWEASIESPLTSATCQTLADLITTGPGPGPSEFIYRGSIGPIELSARSIEALACLGDRVRAALPDYRGYLQADFIEDASGSLWLIEFNPRWTAGMEVLHEAAQTPERSPLGEHLLAWGIAPVAGLAWDKPETKLVSKVIYYSATDSELTQPMRQSLHSLRGWQRTTSMELGNTSKDIEWCLADLPAVTPLAPMRFAMGSPILTVKRRM